MTVRELRERLQGLPDEMPVELLYYAHPRTLCHPIERVVVDHGACVAIPGLPATPGRLSILYTPESQRGRREGGEASPERR